MDLPASRCWINAGTFSPVFRRNLRPRGETLLVVTGKKSWNVERR